MNSRIKMYAIVTFFGICSFVGAQSNDASALRAWIAGLESSKASIKGREEFELEAGYRILADPKSRGANIQYLAHLLDVGSDTERRIAAFMLYIPTLNGDTDMRKQVDTYADKFAAVLIQRNATISVEARREIVRLLAIADRLPFQTAGLLAELVNSDDRETHKLAFHSIVKLSTLHPPATDIALNYLRNRLDRPGEFITAIQAMPTIPPAGADPRFGEFFAAQLPRADVELTEALCMGFSRLGSITTKALPALRAEVNSPLRSDASKEAARACIANLEAQVRRGR